MRVSAIINSLISHHYSLIRFLMPIIFIVMFALSGSLTFGILLEGFFPDR